MRAVLLSRASNGFDISSRPVSSRSSRVQRQFEKPFRDLIHIGDIMAHQVKVHLGLRFRFLKLILDHFTISDIQACADHELDRTRIIGKRCIRPGDD